MSIIKSLRYLKWADTAAVLGLACLIACIWTTGWGMWSSRNWSQSATYLDTERSDLIGVLALTKSARNGHQTPLTQKITPELGAPAKANWSPVPITEEFLFAFMGLLARFMGVFAAVNFFPLLAHILAGLSFYFVARYFRCLISWAFLGGCVFGLAPFFFGASPHHPTVFFAWHIPLFLVVWNWVSSPQGIPPFSKRFWFAISVGFLTGLLHAYYLNIFCQLTLLGGLIFLFKNRSHSAFLSVLGILVATIFSFSLMNLDTWVFQYHHEESALGIDRPFKWLEIYALKLNDLFIPPITHQSILLRSFSQHHLSEAALPTGGTYLGAIGILAFISLGIITLWRIISKQGKDIPTEFWQIFWIFLVFTTGGLNAMAGMMGFTFFRSGYRMSIVILAIALLFLLRLASHYFRKNPRLSRLLATACVLLVIWDQMPVPPSLQERQLADFQISSDRAFAEAMESALPECSSVFQLPIMIYPESPVPGITPYEHLRPYLFSNKLKYSFGLTKSEFARNWGWLPRDIPFPDLVNKVREMGFSAILINRNGYSDRADSLVKALEKQGFSKKLEDQIGDLICIFLVEPTGQM